MQAIFDKATFDAKGSVMVRMNDGRTFITYFPLAAWKWMQNKDWCQVIMWNSDFDQSYSWIRR